LAVPLPSLEAGEQCQVHFALAWSPTGRDGEDGERSVATWLAVDQDAGSILEGAGCA
jgi:hypothetical protein